MKVAVSAAGIDMNAGIDPRFGRCAFFIVVNTDDMSFEAFDNENIALGGGAGIQAAQFIASKGVKAVITGNCGPNAVRTLNAAGVQVIVGQSGLVKDAVEAFKKGALSSTNTPNVKDHFGMGEIPEATASRLQPGQGLGGGRGMGCGRGLNQGMGRGRGMVFSTGSAPTRSVTETGDREKEIESLREQAKEMKRVIETMEIRIRELEGLNH
jgi:predicted Fe-Mo cluster-binding NifX family protein